MSEEICVKVHSYGDNRPLSLVYFDPVSGKKKAKSAGTRDWREAERLAGELQKELEAGRYAPPSKITWQQFRERYAAEHLASLKPKTVEGIGHVLNQVEQHLNPDRLCKVNAAALSKLQAKLREPKVKEIVGQDGKPRTAEIRVKETTIASILRQVRGVGLGGICRDACGRAQGHHAQGGQRPEDERRGRGRGAIRPDACGGH